MEDITLRALRVLQQVSLIAAEDTRTTRKLLSRHKIRQRLVSYNEHSMKARTPRILSALGGGDVALVSEAGMPGISDPGFELVTAVLEAGHDVVAIPGASAVLSALAASGLPSRRFTFIGFLPRRSAERRRELDSLRYDPGTLVIFESPHRLIATLGDIRATLGDRGIAVCRELTKRYEEVFRGSVEEAIQHFTDPRGEFTIVIEGNTSGREEASEEAVTNELRRLKEGGSTAKDATTAVAGAMGIPRREAYRLWLELSDA
ncbi:MAG: 16S rRNA (cytidine(1402)-2'-O)-methyltransferase [Dehalococcoidia bacterium]